LGFGFVFTQSQAATGMLLRSSLAKTPKFLAAAFQEILLGQRKGRSEGRIAVRLLEIFAR
jgi:hypothetical protein